MLVEAWLREPDQADEAYLPADPANYPERCFEMAAADWRFLLRFRRGEIFRAPPKKRRLTPFPQTEYRFTGAARRELREMLGAAHAD